MNRIALDDTLGAVFLGTIATSCLYGITVVQTYIYYKRNASDPAYLQALVFFLWALDSLHLALIVHAVYFYAVTNFSNVFNLLVPTWSILSQIIVTGVSDLAVRGVFCHRVWKLSEQNLLLMVAIATSSLVVFSGSIAFAVKGFSIPSFTELSKISDILYLSLGSGVVADVLIAGSMCVLLAKRRTGFSRTDSVWFAVALGPSRFSNSAKLTQPLIGSLCALLTLLTYASMPDNFVFMAFYFVLPKLFLNSLLATLNARRPLRDANSGGDMVSIPLSNTTNSRLSFSGRPQYSRSHSGHDDPLDLRIQVRTTTDVKTDPDPEEIIVEEESKQWPSVYSRAGTPMAFAV